MNFAYLLSAILCLDITWKLRVVGSPNAFDVIQDSLAALDEDTQVHARRKRALVLFAPHITFAYKPGQKQHQRATYGDTCNGTFYNSHVKPVYEAAEQEDDNQFGTYINATATTLIDTLKELITSDESAGEISSWLQAGCIGWYPMVCSSEGGNGAPVCRCLNSSMVDTPQRHHPHYIHEGGRCRVTPGAFCRYHPQYKSGAKCARLAKCVNSTCVLVAISSQPPSANIFFSTRFYIHLLLSCLIIVLKKLFESE